MENTKLTMDKFTEEEHYMMQQAQENVDNNFSCIVQDENTNTCRCYALPTKYSDGLVYQAIKIANAIYKRGDWFQTFEMILDKNGVFYTRISGYVMSNEEPKIEKIDLECTF